MRVDRLEVLRDYLRTVDEKQFCMSVWHYEKPECGTVMCAFGHGTMIPAFRKAGLKMLPTGVPAFAGPFGIVTGLEAARQFFEIDDHNARWLFIDSHRPNIQDVVSRIDDMIVNNRGALCGSTA